MKTLKWDSLNCLRLIFQGRAYLVDDDVEGLIKILLTLLSQNEEVLSSTDKQTL